MTPHSKILSGGLFALFLSCSGLALAQAATDEAPTPDPPPPPPAPAATDVNPPTSTTPPPGAVPLSTMNQADDAHPQVVEHQWPNRPLLITGGVLLVGTYGASAIVAAESDRKADDKLFIPVVGPWLDLKRRDCDVNACGSDTFNKILIGGSGVLQGAGALMVLLGLVVPESKEKPWYLIGDEKLSVSPQVGSALTGVTASGHF